MAFWWADKGLTGYEILKSLDPHKCCWYPIHKVLQLVRPVKPSTLNWVQGLHYIVNLLQIPHNRHPIAGPCGRGMGCLLWVCGLWDFNEILDEHFLSQLQWFMAEIPPVKLPSEECHQTLLMSTLVQVMAWCRQATSHYLSQCWPSFLSPYGVTRP